MVVMIPFQVDTTKIRMERARLNLDKTQLAEKIGETRFVIGSIENEKYKTVKREILQKLADAFNLKVEDLLKKEER
ncbi:MAG: helix-turn-helix domain-containing protein [Clostridia bacterium]|nr:helix-turn-helix domain-containing protein [Clostridia bacterium]